MSASALGWGPGYPNCQASKMATLVRADGFRQPLRREIIPLVAWLMDETERRGYNIRPDWSWGYNCRAIRGYPGVPSNHSWGLAIDINAPTNPMLHGRPGWLALHNSGRTDMPAWMPGLWMAHGFGWGGNYSNRQDAMHYEVLVTPADIARITASLHSPTGPLKLSKTLHVGDKGRPGHPTGGLGDQIAHVQDLLHFYAVKYKARDVEPGSPDGNYGAKTGAAVLAFKARVHALQVALGGHLTFHAPLDNSCGAVTLGALEYWAKA